MENEDDENDDISEIEERDFSESENDIDESDDGR